MTGGPDNSTPAPAPARPAGRRFRLRLAAVSRWLHIYTSMLGLAAVLFFSITGLTLNHPDWMFGSVRRQNDYRGRLPAEWLAKSGQGSDQLRIVEFLRREHRLHGAVEEFREDDSGGSISFRGPGYSADVFFDPAVGKYDVSEVSEGLVAVLNDLHKGRHTGPAWSAVIDISAVLLIIVSASGLVLLLFIRRRRTAGIVAAVIGTAVMLAIAWMLVP